MIALGTFNQAFHPGIKPAGQATPREFSATSTFRGAAALVPTCRPFWDSATQWLCDSLNWLTVPMVGNSQLIAVLLKCDLYELGARADSQLVE
jgi:hypothetical protein